MISAMVVKGLQRSTQWVAEWVAEIYTVVWSGTKSVITMISNGATPRLPLNDEAAVVH